MTKENLKQEIENQKQLMTAVATGGPRIDAVNNEYIARSAILLQELKILNITDPNPYPDLWRCYAKWSTDLPSYASRRAFISDLYQPLLDQLNSTGTPIGSGCFEEPIGWQKIDRVVDKIRNQLVEENDEEGFQTVGLLCRELMISVAQTVFNPETDFAPDGIIPSDTDAKRMLEAYLNRALPGDSNEAARKHAKASFDFANTLQHKRTADFRTAAMCAEASISLTNTIAIVQGKRDTK